MVLGLISIAVGLVGFGWAGWKDLRTTEFPDWLPYSIIITALGLRGVFSFLQGDFSLIINSVFVGVPFLAFGLGLYYAKQWGDGDAWLLGAMGFLLPDGLGLAGSVLPFPVALMFTFFFVAFFYIVAYSLIVGLKSKKNKKFLRSMKVGLARVVGMTAVFSAALAGAILYMEPRLVGLLYTVPPLLFLLLLFAQYGKLIESTMFRKRISVKQLKEGDVPVGEKWRVLNKKEIARLKKRGGHIWIKEGVRFAPVFVITVAVMLFYGNLWGSFTWLLGI